MKKIISIMAIMSILMVLILAGSVHAATLGSPSVSVDKELVRPGEDVTVTLDFGEKLGAYKVSVDYDNKIFDYVSAEGGTGKDEGTKVTVEYTDSEPENDPKQTVSVTFKAKAELTTSNSTELSVTANDIKGTNLSTGYDPITQKMTKTITVEPIYIDYALNLTTDAQIIKGEEIPMVLSYSSPMGKYYEQARLNVEATTPEGATLKLLGTDMSGTETDLVTAGGWGDPQGSMIGGKDVSQVLNLRGIFSEAGNYTVTLKLIDRENGDTPIAQHSFTFTAVDSATAEEPQEETPTELPKTGNNFYVPVIIVLVAILGSYIYFNKRK